LEAVGFSETYEIFYYTDSVKVTKTAMETKCPPKFLTKRRGF